MLCTNPSDEDKQWTTGRRELEEPAENAHHGSVLSAGSSVNRMRVPITYVPKTTVNRQTCFLNYGDRDAFRYVVVAGCSAVPDLHR
ncbi:MAG: hypothetical protein WD942_05205 [Dehalococcoidia bacterium]